MRRILRALGIQESPIRGEGQYVFHPWSGTWMSVDECVLVDYDDIPDELK